jgi:hypothetical protein
MQAGRSGGDAEDDVTRAPDLVGHRQAFAQRGRGDQQHQRHQRDDTAAIVRQRQVRAQSCQAAIRVIKPGRQHIEQRVQDQRQKHPPGGDLVKRHDLVDAQPARGRLEPARGHELHGHRRQSQKPQRRARPFPRVQRRDHPRDGEEKRQRAEDEIERRQRRAGQFRQGSRASGFGFNRHRRSFAFRSGRLGRILTARHDRDQGCQRARQSAL